MSERAMPSELGFDPICAVDGERLEGYVSQTWVFSPRSTDPPGPVPKRWRTVVTFMCPKWCGPHQFVVLPNQHPLASPDPKNPDDRPPEE